MSIIRGREDEWINRGEIGVLDYAWEALRRSEWFGGLRRWWGALVPGPNRMMINLRKQQVFSLDFRKNVRVRCMSGKTWITIQGIPGDHLLETGQANDYRGGGKALMVGLEESTHLRIHCY